MNEAIEAGHLPSKLELQAVGALYLCNGGSSSSSGRAASTP